jgi:hypothetical protein
MAAQFSLNKTFTFVTRAPSILGASVINAKLVGIMVADTARKTSNIDLQYRKIFPLLPSGTPDDVNSCTYYEFIGESGERFIYADQWIDMASVELIDSITITAVIANASMNDVSRIRDALNAMGYRSYNLTTRTT